MRFLGIVLLLAALGGCLGDGSTPDAGTDDEAGNGADDGGDDGAGNGSADDSNGTNQPAEPREPVTWTITISANSFVDGSITVQEGDTVQWVHEDGTTPHTVTADDGAFHSGDCPGTSCMTEISNPGFEHTFDDVGEFGYHCQVHPSMTGTITVMEVYNQTPGA